MNVHTEPGPLPDAVPPPPHTTHPCANCGAPMYGPFCYACGQPEKGMIRHLASVMADMADTVFNVDSRIFRSIPPLYFRPGFLTNEYFAGRRTRYVTPFRLFFFLCVISFFAIQVNMDLGGIHLDLGDSDSRIAGAQTTAELDANRKAELASLDAAAHAPGVPPRAREKMEAARAKLDAKASERRAWLEARDAARAKGQPPPRSPEDDGDGMLMFDGVMWDPAAHPFEVTWLPAFANAKLTEMAVHAKENLVRARRDQSHLIAGIFSVLPQTLFVLMPLFAVLLKIAYIFKRRLYMEHLMVALHSHAFIFMSLLLVTLVHVARGWTDVHAGWASPLLGLLSAAMWAWLPIYLFLMARRVYRQGWLMTTIKFCFIGTCYMVMLAFGLAGATLVSLAVA